MYLNGHILYFDITNVCKVGCEFCMYKKERKKPEMSLHLNRISSENIHRLINHPGTDCIFISGEGEPFSNEFTLKQILNLSKGGKKFQIVTNGLWEKSSVPERFHELNRIAQKNDDQYTVRLSIDSYHSHKIGLECYKQFFDFIESSSDEVPNVSLAIRGLVEDKSYIRKLISKIILKLKINHELREISILEDELSIKNTTIHINYKNLVNPYILGRCNPFKLGDYIIAIEKKCKKTFTLGNLNTIKGNKGLNLTIKPDGDIFFYGAEIHPYGNVFTDRLGIKRFTKIVNENPLIKTLYTFPFYDLINKLRKNPELSNRIDEINNPYWIIKGLYKTHKEEICKIIKMYPN